MNQFDFSNQAKTPQGIHPYEILFGPWSQGVALVILLGAAILVALGKTSGIGIELCWLKRITALPCPGCGMTRSVCHLVQAQWVETVRLNPFSLLVMPWALLSLSSSLWTEPVRLGMRRWLGDRRRSFSIFYGTLVIAFVAFGMLRALGVALGLGQWP